MNIATIIIVSSLASSPTFTNREFFDAVRQTETGGQANGGRDSVGDGGKSIGPYQIGVAYWRDSGVAGRYEDVRNADYAEKVMAAYWRRYCPDALKSCDYETLARVHNGGPRGHLKRATEPYWSKVKAFMQNAR